MRFALKHLSYTEILTSMRFALKHLSYTAKNPRL